MKFLTSSRVFSAILLLSSNLASAASYNYSSGQKNIKLDYTGLAVQTKEVPSYIGVINNFTSNKARNLVTLYLTPASYKGTNLQSAWMNLAVDASITDETNCYQTSYYGTPTKLDKIRTVQNNNWHYAQSLQGQSDAAMHHVINTETYRLYKNNTCYEVVLGAVSVERSVLANPNSVKNFNSKNIFDKLGAIFNRLQIN